MENLAAIVGKNLATLRKAKGLTQQDLAQEIHYSDKSISKWELGYSLPSVDVLKDFADFYGVTVDYLIAEQSDEDLAAKAQVDQEDLHAREVNQALTIALSLAFIVLGALSIFFTAYYNPFNLALGSVPGDSGLWIIFVWMVPVCIAVAAVEAWHYWHKRLPLIILSSTFMWTLLLSLCIQFQFFNTNPEPIWHVLVVGIPVQAIIIIWGNFRRKKKPADAGK